MNKNVRLIIISAIVLLNVAVIFGQEEKQIDKSAFQAATDAGQKNLTGKTYRLIRTEEKFADRNASPILISKSIYETIPPDRDHWIDEEGGKKTEMIVIGIARYLRINNGAWKRDDRGGIGSGVGNGITVESETYKLIENVKLNGKIADLYEKITKLTSFSDDEAREVWTERHWITKDGLLIKTEHESKKEAAKAFTLSKTVYEYDSKIRIVAPIK